MTFNYIPTTRNAKLDNDTLQLLEQIDAFEYPALPGFNTLGELHKTLTLEITDNIPDRKYTERMSIADIKARIKELKKEKTATEKRNEDLREKFYQTNDHNLRNQLERQMKGFRGYSELEELEGILQQNEGKPDDYVVEITGTTSRLGYYTRKGNDAKIVLEYNFGAEFISTYIHEMMHAFYDSDRLGDSPNSIEYVEEPLAEYGMLHFMKTFVQAHPEHSDLLDDAINMVNEKQYTLGISHYAFGEYLYQYYSHIEWEKLMLDAINKVNVNSPEYKSLQGIFQSRPDKSSWDKAAQLLYDILAKASGNPSAKIAKKTSKTTSKRKATGSNDSTAPLNIDKDTYDSWLKRFQEEGILPSEEEMDKAMNNPSIQGASVAPVTSGPSILKVTYQSPYESFGPNYGLELEYNYDTDDLQCSICGRGDSSKTLTPAQIESIKEYLKDRRNIENFFNKAKSTAPNTSFTHFRSHDMSMEYGDRSKSVSNGELMPWAKPFAELCEW